MRVSDQRDRMRSSILQEWPDEAVPRWWVQDEAQKRGLAYAELWQALQLLGFRIVPRARPDGGRTRWELVPKVRGTRISPDVLASFAPPPRRGKGRNHPPEPSPPSNSRERILGLLEERYPCKLAPTGTWKALAEEVGVSAERVRQLATEAGWSLVPREPVRYQCICGRVQRAASLCDDCRFVELPCEGCAKLVRTSAAQLARRVARSTGSLAYTGRVFCGRPCMGRWVAHNWRDQGKAARIEQLRLVLEERFPSRAAPHGTWRALARELGMSRGWVTEEAGRLGWAIARGTKPLTRGASVER